MIIRIIQQLLWGKATRGIPVTDIRMSCHTIMPTERVPLTQMHIVIAQAMQETQQRLKD